MAELVCNCYHKFYYVTKTMRKHITVHTHSDNNVDRGSSGGSAITLSALGHLISLRCRRRYTYAVPHTVWSFILTTSTRAFVYVQFISHAYCHTKVNTAPAKNDDSHCEPINRLTVRVVVLGRWILAPPDGRGERPHSQALN